jgi:flagellar hook-associated protein 3 FlgL
LSNGLDKVLSVRANVGLRLAEIDALQTVGDELHLHYEETLSRLQDVDYAQAISQLTREQTNLEAAQKSFARVSQLSLFNYL